jgi:hypothetical protein
LNLAETDFSRFFIAAVAQYPAVQIGRSLPVTPPKLGMAYGEDGVTALVYGVSVGIEQF